MIWAFRAPEPSLSYQYLSGRHRLGQYRCGGIAIGAGGDQLHSRRHLLAQGLTQLACSPGEQDFHGLPFWGVSVMPRMQPMANSALEQAGWVLVAPRGSHRQFKHPLRPGRVTVAGRPSDDLAPGR